MRAAKQVLPLAIKICKYELQAFSRTRMPFFLTIFWFIISAAFLFFSSDAEQTFVSLMNIIFLFIPLMSLIIGSNNFYNSKEFIELLLTYPIPRMSVYLGKIFGLLIVLMGTFLLGTGSVFLLKIRFVLPVIGQFALLTLIGLILVWIFICLSTLIAIKNNDRSKGLGLIIFLWLFFFIIYDALIMLFIVFFQEYPFEPFLILFVMLNPIDLARILLLMQTDVAALLGYSGANYLHILGSVFGTLWGIFVLLVWSALPMVGGYFMFKKKDF